MAARRVIGVDLGGTKLLAGVVDPSLGVHHRTQRTVTGLQQRALLDVAVDAVAESREAAGTAIEAVGFGLPVLMDRRSTLGTAVVGVNTPLHDLPFADVMSERLGLPVFVDNDGNTSALAEHRAGAAHGFSEAVVITLGTGIAGGLILRDELYRGAFGAAGELGHMVIELDGPRCHGNCRAVVAERVLPFLRDGVPIVAARFGVEAGMVGAAALAYDEIERGVAA
jgi:glucokinase